MPKPKTKDLARRGTETTTQRVKMQMREAAGRDVSPESYGGDTIEDSAQYVADRAADGIREMGSSIKDKAAEQIKERIERVRQLEDGPETQEPDSGHTASQEPQHNRAYSESQHDAPARPQDQPVEAAPDSLEAGRPDSGRRAANRSRPRIPISAHRGRTRPLPIRRAKHLQNHWMQPSPDHSPMPTGPAMQYAAWSAPHPIRCGRPANAA